MITENVTDSPELFLDEYALVIPDSEYFAVEDRFVILGLSAENRALVVVHFFWFIFHYHYPLRKPYKQIRSPQQATLKPKSQIKLDDVRVGPLRIPPHPISLVLSKKPSTIAAALAVAHDSPTKL